MRGWLIGLGLILLLNLLAVGSWHYDDGLQESFENLDTRVILKRLKQPHSAWEWFTGDWVLGNGFYRPLPSVLYQLDYWLWGENLLAWKWTNGVLATLNALLLVGFVWALSGRRDLALLSGLAFTFWQSGLLPSPPFWLGWVGLAAGALWGWRVSDWRRGVLWGCVAFALIVELRFIPILPDIHLQSFAYRAVGWIPGRTATLMTLFSLFALTGACLYARTGRLHWAALGLLGFAGALLSYEQAVVLPILMALCGLSVSLKQWGRGLSVSLKHATGTPNTNAYDMQDDTGGTPVPQADARHTGGTPAPQADARHTGGTPVPRAVQACTGETPVPRTVQACTGETPVPRAVQAYTGETPVPRTVQACTGGTPVLRTFALPLLCLLLLIPYFAFYRTHIPTDTQYHQQRLKRFKTLPETALYWLVPTGREAITQIDVARTAPFNLLIPPFWMGLLGVIAYLMALREGLRLRLGWVGWLGSLIAYAPLMPVLPLMHYYYLSAGFRALWVGILLLCLHTLRPTRRGTSDATAVAMCPKR